MPVSATPPTPSSPLLELPALTHPHLWAIHYSQDLPANCPNSTPAVSAIILEHIASGQQTPFAAITLAEEGCEVEDFLTNLDLYEEELLRAFFAFVVGHPDAVYLHWGMRASDFGFEVFDLRARRSTIRPAVIPSCQRFDLSAYLKDRFGNDFAPDPRLPSTLKANGVMRPEFLDYASSVKAWSSGEYAALRRSLSAKVKGIADIFRSIHQGRFVLPRDAIATSVRTAAAKHTEEVDNLPEGAEAVLAVLLENVCTSRENPMKLSRIVSRTKEGEGRCKSALKRLKLDGKVDTKEGSGGGYYLTSSGVELATGIPRANQLHETR